MTTMTDMARVVDIGLRVLTPRFLTILALTGAFALYSWAMAIGTTLGVVIAGAYSITVFLPTLFCDRKPEAKWQSDQTP